MKSNLIGRLILIIFLFNSILWSIILGSVIAHSFKHKEFVYRECEYTYNYYASETTYTREECKQKICNMFNNPFHFYSEISFGDGTLGETRQLLCWVCIEKNCCIDDYIFTYTHELIHLTENVSNERYTNYKTFIKLYESGDKQFKAVAERYLYWDLSGTYAKEYTCGYYIVQYLEHKT